MLNLQEASSTGENIIPRRLAFKDFLLSLPITKFATLYLLLILTVYFMEKSRSAIIQLRTSVIYCHLEMS